MGSLDIGKTLKVFLLDRIIKISKR